MHGRAECRGMKTVLCVLLVVATGCKRPAPEQTYKGRSESHWLSLTQDADANTRLSAYDALSHISTPESDAALVRSLSDRSVSPYTVIYTANRHPNETAAVVNTILSGPKVDALRFAQRGVLGDLLDRSYAVGIAIRPAMATFRKSLNPEDTNEAFPAKELDRQMDRLNSPPLPAPNP